MLTHSLVFTFYSKELSHEHQGLRDVSRHCTGPAHIKNEAALRSNHRMDGWVQTKSTATSGMSALERKVTKMIVY